MSGVMSDLTLREVAQQIDVSPATLRRWVRDGIVPLGNGRWTPAAVAHARLVARLRERGHSLDTLREAGRSGRLAYGYLEDLFPAPARTRTLEEAADECGLEAELIRRIWTAVGFSADALERIDDEDLQLLRYMAAVLEAGFPLVAFLQLVRVYGQALAQIADAEVKLFHLYVHEPLMRDGVPNLEIAETMEGIAADLLPLASPIMDRVHQRMLQHFVGQDVVGHLELDEAGEDLGRLRVAIAFADLAGYTRLTEEAGEEEALDVVERFVESVVVTLPDEARVVKTIGDEVMVVGADPATLVDWAVGFQELNAGVRPLPRIGVHSGDTLYRDGDYYGRAVNLASRVGARAAGGEVLVTEQVVAAAGDHLAFEPIGEVKLKGFNEATELYLARARP
jgi:adenylate cyclase